MSTNIEADQEKTLYVPGFAAFSDLIASDEDHTSAIYKRFDKLVARDLLYYESELMQLQAEQDQYDKEDSQGILLTTSNEWEAIRNNAQDFSSFEQNAKIDVPDGKWIKRMKLAERIRKTLKAYRKAILLDAQIRALGSPDKRSMNAISQAFHNEGDTVLTGPNVRLYPDPYTRVDASEKDYVAVRLPSEGDLLTSLLKRIWPILFGRGPPRSSTLTHASHAQMSYYSLKLLDLTAKLISTFFAAVLLLAPMLSLYQVSNRPRTTMGLIVMFTVLFAATLALVTTARRGEIFGATAAYAAVLVVFVSGDFASGNNSQG